MEATAKTVEALDFPVSTTLDTCQEIFTSDTFFDARKRSSRVAVHSTMTLSRPLFFLSHGHLTGCVPSAPRFDPAEYAIIGALALAGAIKSEVTDGKA
jgi:hypothetical protein